MNQPKPDPKVIEDLMLNGYKSDSQKPKASDELREKLFDLVPCIDPCCDKRGTSVQGDLNNEPEPMQCQFCYQARFSAIDKILELFHQAQLDLLERVEAEVLFETDNRFDGQYRNGYNSAVNEIGKAIESIKLSLKGEG